jgi:WhiB family redox-sensing transcriptional regulator
MNRWREQAACRTSPPEMFFPLKAGGIEEHIAKQVCARCPVVEQCLEFAHGHLSFGIAGGLNGDERAAIRDHHHDRVGGGVR